MSVPGVGMGGNSVGSIFVSVYTDTSGMKGQIEDAAKPAGAAGNRQFNKGWQEEASKPGNDLLFSKAVQGRMKKSAKKFGKEFSQSLITGVGDPSVNLDRIVSDDLSRIASKFGKLPKDVKEQWEKEFRGILSSQMDKEIAKVKKNMGGLGKSLAKSVLEGFGSEVGQIDLKDLTDRVTKSIADGVLQSEDDFDRLFGDEVRELKVRLDLEDVDIAGSIRRRIPAAIAQFQKLEEIRVQQEERVYNEAVAFNQKYNAQATAEAKKRAADILRITEQLIAKDQRERDVLDAANIRRGLEVLKENSRLMDKWADQIDLVDQQYRELFRTTDAGYRRLTFRLDVAGRSTRILSASLRRLRGYAVTELIRPEALLDIKAARDAMARLGTRILDRGARIAEARDLSDRSMGLTLAQARANARANLAADFGPATAKAREFFNTLADGVKKTRAFRAFIPEFLFEDTEGALSGARQFGRKFGDALSVGLDSSRARLKKSVRLFYDTWVDKQEVARMKAQAQRAANLMASPFRKFFRRGGAGGLPGRVEPFQFPMTVDQDAFRLSILTAAENVEKRLTPAVRDALTKGQKVDWNFSKAANKEIDKIADHFQITFKQAADSVGVVLGDSIKRNMREANDERNLAIFDKFGQRTNRFAVGLFRAGGSGPFGILTSLLGTVVGTFTTVFNLILSIPKMLNKVGEAFQAFGSLIMKVFGPIGKVIGGAVKGLGSALIKFAKNPLVLAATAVLALTSGLGFARTVLFGIVGAVRAFGGVITLLGGALYYTAAAAVILGPALVAVGAGMVALFLGAKDAFGAMSLLNTAVSSGKQEDWDAYNEALAKLGPNARDAVRQMRPLFEGLKRVRAELSEKIFAGIGDQIKTLLPKLSPIRTAFVNLGDSLNAAFKSIFTLFGEQTFIQDIVTLLTNAKPIIENFGTAIANVVGGIASVFATISPLAVRFSEALVRGSEGFRSSVEENKEPILKFFTQAYEVASQVWDIIFSLGRVLAALFGATYDPNTGPQGLLTTINNKLTGIKTWIDNNPGVISKWFEDSKDVLGTVGGLITTVLDGLKNMDSEEIQSAITTVIGWVGNLAAAINAVAGALDKLGANAKEWADNPISQGGGGFGGGFDPLKVPQSAESRQAIKNRIPVVGTRARHAAGGLIRQKELAWIGESGPELVIPLRRPLGLIDPAARPAARLLRDKERERHSTGPTKVVNLTQNITPVQSDPRAVAQSVVNRAVAVARG